MKLLSIIFILVFSFSVFGQKDLTAASQSVNEYLNAIKLIDLPESKTTITSLEFSPAKSYPVFTESTILAERLYPTDVPDIFSYRRLFSIKGVSKAGTELIKKYVLVAYKDHTTQRWKVLGFSEGTDVESEAASAGNDLDDTKYIAAKYNYRRYGFWLLMAGKINQAKEVFEKSLKLNQENSTTETEQKVNAFNASITENLVIINKITVKDSSLPKTTNNKKTSNPRLKH
ncbi:MAG: hypothetical protein ACR2MG_09455 [Pyrinomonadaceae bacterium]